MLRAATQLGSAPAKAGYETGALSSLARQKECADAVRNEARQLFKNGPIPPGFGILRGQKRPNPALLYATLTLAEAIGTETRLGRMLQRGAVSIVGLRLRQMLSAAERQAQMILSPNRGLIIEMGERLAENFAMGAEELAEYSKRVVVPALPSGPAGEMVGTNV